VHLFILVIEDILDSDGSIFKEVDLIMRDFSWNLPVSNMVTVVDKQD